MELVLKIFTLLFSIIFLGYLSYPTPDFPNPPDDAIQSLELADTETPFRRAYFTDYTREEVVAHYNSQMKYLPTLRLNYPPEDAEALIRDQTRSVYLEELVHPLRESVFINGFRAKEAKDDIWYKGVHYSHKITIRYVPTSIYLRLGVGFFTVMLALALIKEFKNLTNE